MSERKKGSVSFMILFRYWLFVCNQPDGLSISIWCRSQCTGAWHNLCWHGQRNKVHQVNIKPMGVASGGSPKCLLHSKWVKVVLKPVLMQLFWFSIYMHEVFFGIRHGSIKEYCTWKHQSGVQGIRVQWRVKHDFRSSHVKPSIIRLFLNLTT